MKSASIKSKLLTLITLCVICSVALNSTLLIHFSSQALKSSIQDRMLDYITVYEKSITNHFDSLYKSISMNRQLQDLINGSETEISTATNVPTTQTTVSIDTVLQNILFNYNEALYVDLSNTDGEVLSSTEDTRVGTNISDESYFQKIISGYTYAQSELKQDTDTQYFHFAAALNDNDNNLAGVISIAFPANYLANILSSSSDNHMQAITISQNNFMEHAPNDMPVPSDSSTATDASTVPPDNNTPLPNDVNMPPSDTPSSENSTEISVQMQGLDSVNAYIIDANDTIISHTDSSLIGTTLDTTISSSQDMMTGNSEYIINNESRYNSYISIPSADWILVIDVLQSEINQPITFITYLAIVIGFILVITFALIGYLVSSKIIKPISLTTDLLKKLAALDFTDFCISSSEFSNDETGTMLRSVVAMSEKFKEVIAKLEQFTTTISNNSTDLSHISATLSHTVEENSCSTQEVSASMEETSATYHVLTENITHIRDNTSSIAHSLNQNIASCSKMIDVATQLRTTSVNASTSTKEIFDSVKKDIDIALKGANAIQKIDEMAEVIKNIANQTSLLALNASIEAARAGENGRGFSVVATEIGTLAQQSSETVSNISTVIQEVKHSADLLKNMLITVLNFMDEKVLSDYQTFENISTTYNTDANKLNLEMTQMYTLVSHLLATLKEMDTSLEHVSGTLHSASENILSIADKNTEIVDIASKTHIMSEAGKENVCELEQLVSLFKL